MKEAPVEPRCRELAIAAGRDPDERLEKDGTSRGVPLWTTFRGEVSAERSQAKLAASDILSPIEPQAARYQDAPLFIYGQHDDATIAQMRTCMQTGNVVAGAICADGHLGYAQPVGGVIAYEDQISISGVGFDIGCGNMAVRLDVNYTDIEARLDDIIHDISTSIAFGVGRVNNEPVEHDLFDDQEAWRDADMGDYKTKARAQLGTVGSGNHYVDVLEDECGYIWIGVHFGSRGLGHTSATRYLKAAGGKEGIHVAPAVVDVKSEIGCRYIAAMELAGRYAYAGREWVVERVRKIIGGSVMDMVHNHHNYAWQEEHFGRNTWVVRKGATPCWPGQRGFVGGSMGDPAVILHGMHGPQAAHTLHSTVHGSGRLFGRQEAKRRFTRERMNEWLAAGGVRLIGGDIDESPMAYRRLSEVLAYHEIDIEFVLQPRAVVMAGSGEFDPFKD